MFVRVVHYFCFAISFLVIKNLISNQDQTYFDSEKNNV